MKVLRSHFLCDQDSFQSSFFLDISAHYQKQKLTKMLLQRG